MNWREWPDFIPLAAWRRRPPGTQKTSMGRDAGLQNCNLASKKESQHGKPSWQKGRNMTQAHSNIHPTWLLQTAPSNSNTWAPCKPRLPWTQHWLVPLRTRAMSSDPFAFPVGIPTAQALNGQSQWDAAEQSVWRTRPPGLSSFIHITWWHALAAGWWISSNSLLSRTKGSEFCLVLRCSLKRLQVKTKQFPRCDRRIFRHNSKMVFTPAAPGCLHHALLASLFQTSFLCAKPRTIYLDLVSPSSEQHSTWHILSAQNMFAYSVNKQMNTRIFQLWPEILHLISLFLI